MSASAAASGSVLEHPGAFSLIHTTRSVISSPIYEVQTESKYEKVIINQIVDRRSSSKRPTGMLTNSNMEEMTKLLGERVMDRMRLGNSLWVIFNWDSYRSRVTGKEY